MAIDTVTLEMIGHVSLHEFSTTVGRLESLLGTLSSTIGEGAEITWLVDDLVAIQAESALTAYRGLPNGATGPAQVERVVRAYGDVGSALQSGSVQDLAPPVVQEAERLVSVLNGRVTSLRFETPEMDATVSTASLLKPSTSGQVVTARLIPTPSPAYGAVEGRIQTLTNRGGVRFTLYDTLHDKAVSCWLTEDFDQERMRDAWGHRVIVAGLITRESDGRPRNIRQVSEVVVLPELAPGDYTRARGAVRVPLGTEPPEVRIRRFRDAD